MTTDKKYLEELTSDVEQKYTKLSKRLKEIASLVIGSGVDSDGMKEISSILLNEQKNSVNAYDDIVTIINNLLADFKLKKQEKKTLSDYLLAKSLIEAFKNREYGKWIFPIVRRVFPGLIANDIVSVQPMSLPSGAIFFHDFKYGSTK